MYLVQLTESRTMVLLVLTWAFFFETRKVDLPNTFIGFCMSPRTILFQLIIRVHFHIKTLFVQMDVVLTLKST